MTVQSQGCVRGDLLLCLIQLICRSTLSQLEAKGLHPDCRILNCTGVVKVRIASMGLLRSESPLEIAQIHIDESRQKGYSQLPGEWSLEPTNWVHAPPYPATQTYPVTCTVPVCSQDCALSKTWSELITFKKKLSVGSYERSYYTLPLMCFSCTCRGNQTMGLTNVLTVIAVWEKQKTGQGFTLHLLIPLTSHCLIGWCPFFFCEVRRGTLTLFWCH